MNDDVKAIRSDLTHIKHRLCRLPTKRGLLVLIGLIFGAFTLAQTIL